MTPRPKVSVVVPSYNHARHLPRRLESILAQTHGDFELLFLDDASPDGTREIFARYAGDPRIRAVFNESNGGSVFRQWNRGLRMAAGDYVWIAESDDYSDPGFLAEMVGRLDRHPGVGVACCQSRVVDADDRELGLSSAWYDGLDPVRWKADFVASGPDECRNHLVRQNTIPNASGAVFRRALALEAGGAPEHLRLAGDWWFWTELLSRADLAYAAAPLNFYRKHPATVSAASERESVDVEESYLVARHVASRHAVAPSVLEAARARFAGQWFRASLARGGLGWRRHRALYRVARPFDPRVLRRLAGHWLALRAGSPGRAWARLRDRRAGPA
jgi:glycosyltransferase involved in cell wall biosynthesis